MAAPTRQTTAATHATVARFSVERLAYLDAAGQPIGALPPFAADGTHLLELYRHMLLARRFDARAVALQRTGKLGTYAQATGQEAVPVGVTDAMIDADVLLPAYREGIAQVMRGVSMAEILRYWGGDERGCDYADPRARCDFPPAVPVASQIPHAAGVAFALKKQGVEAAAVSFVGDGGSSKGDFYEAINLAGVWRLPLVVIITNNQWAISVPRSRQTAAETLAQKAIAAGITGLQVDGNDVIAVRQAADAALKRAREQRQASLIEAVTYRACDHTTADDASRYRSAEALERARQQDPIRRLQAFLRAHNLLDEAAQQAMEDDCDRRIEAAVEEYLATPPREPASIFEHLFAEPTAELRTQRQALTGVAHG